MENTITEVKWWEKTVEYNFVLAAKDDFGLNLLAPFDGNVESVGDALVGSKSHFFIIEFKRTLSDFISEYKKYNKGEEGFKEAKDLLARLDESKYHYVIGGEYKEGGEGLTLKIKRYFNVDCVTELNPDEIFEGGMTVNELNQYTKWFTEFKNHNHSSDDSDGSGSAGSGGLSHSFVLAVDKNKKTTIIPVDYYVKFSLRNKNAFKPCG